MTIIDVPRKPNDDLDYYELLISNQYLLIKSILYALKQKPSTTSLFVIEFITDNDDFINNLKNKDIKKDNEPYYKIYLNTFDELKIEEDFFEFIFDNIKISINYNEIISFSDIINDFKIQPIHRIKENNIIEFKKYLK